jgi:hypothetical protein
MANKEFNRVVTLEQLSAVPKPEMTKSYKPIIHNDLNSMIMEGIANNGFDLIDTKFLAARNGSQAIGQYNIRFDNNPDYGIKVIFQNSYDKSLTLKLVCGVHTFICTNGAAMGDMGAWKSKHVGEVQEITPQKATEFLKGAGETFFKIISDKQKMRDIEVTKRTTAELLGRMFLEESIITANQLGAIKKSMEYPVYDYGVQGSLLNIYEDVTCSLRDAHPQFWLTQHQNLHSFITKEYQIASL